jgi:hypothetical protein
MKKLYELTEKAARAPLDQFYSLERTPKMNEETKMQFRKMVKTRKCLVHGDFHSGNILLGDDLLRNPNDKNGSIYLLDLESIGESHYLKDFVALEASVRIDLMDWKMTRDAEEVIRSVEAKWLNDEKTRICEATKIVEPLVAKWLSIENKKASKLTDCELHKAHVVIGTIRAIAQGLAISLGMSKDEFNREYRLCLVWYLHKYLNFGDIATAKKRYAVELLDFIETNQMSIFTTRID